MFLSTLAFRHLRNTKKTHCRLHKIMQFTCYTRDCYKHKIKGYRYICPCSLLIKHHAMKTYWGLDIQFHHPRSRHWMEVSGQLHASATSPSGKELPVPIRRLGGSQRRYGHRGVEKCLTSAGNRTPSVKPLFRCYINCDTPAARNIK
jgi:hypothetical protein